ncbi:MAG TPA: hypothetical protein VH040_09415 [Usitatibacter sp.]|nr:hypothetical protein [Usitatibacter sp.]
MDRDSERWPEIDGLNWRQRLLKARSQEEVMRLCRDFVAEWPPVRIRLLPNDCVPPKLADAEAVTGYSGRLVRAELRVERVINELQLMTNFFSAASARLAQVIPTKP